MIKRMTMLALALALTACSIVPGRPAPSLFDLGTDELATPALPARAPIALAFRSAPSLAGTGVIWRVEGSVSPQAYATYQWASAPYELVRQRMIERLSRQGPVLGEQTRGMPQLQLTLLRFEQVFSADGRSSEGHVVLQAVLWRDGKAIEQLRIAQAAAASSQDAAGGVQALRVASDAAADDLAQWLAKTL